MTVAIRTHAELYNKGTGIKVNYSLPDYYLSIGNSSIRMDPKALENLSMASPEEFSRQMREIKPSFRAILKREGLTQEEVQLALTQAFITDERYKKQDSKVDEF